MYVRYRSVIKSTHAFHVLYGYVQSVLNIWHMPKPATRNYDARVRSEVMYNKLPSCGEWQLLNKDML